MEEYSLFVIKQINETVYNNIDILKIIYSYSSCAECGEQECMCYSYEYYEYLDLKDLWENSTDYFG